MKHKKMLNWFYVDGIYNKYTVILSEAILSTCIKLMKEDKHVVCNSSDVDTKLN